MRHLLCLASLSLVACSRPRPVAPGPPDLLVFYASGVRGAVATPKAGAGGMARRATLVDRARVNARALLQVDAGDLTPRVQDEASLTELAARADRTRLVFQSYRRMGVDVVTLGESDWALGSATLQSLAREEKVRVVAANVRGKDGKSLFPAHESFEAGTVKVGVFGIFEDGPGAPPLPEGLTVTDPQGAAREAAAALRGSGVQLVIGLFHLAGGRARAQAIADAAGGIDVIVLGHAEEPAPPRFVAVAPRGAELGLLQVRLDEKRRTVGGEHGAVSLEDRRFAVAPDVPEQYGVRLLLRATEPVYATFLESEAALSKAKGRRTYGEEWQYSTTALCKACHASQFAQWASTDHAHAFASLTDGREKEPGCMGCHMTGFLVPDGVQNFESAHYFVDVGCEDCHGPSTAHVTSVDKHRGTSRAVDPVLCFGCHTPDQNRGPFVLAEAMKEIVGPGHGQPLPPSPAH